jgi:ADP-heptose:LPS heptosyltransferase
MNFEELMNLINENDLIVGADSLPVHLCHLLNKQHYMLFPNNHPRQFITPFTETNEYFGEFDHYDVSFL